MGQFLGPETDIMGERYFMPEVKIHNKQKTLQKTQVGEGVLTTLKNLIVPELKALKNYVKFLLFQKDEKSDKVEECAANFRQNISK